jgi:PleD family two-component response regulator
VDTGHVIDVRVRQQDVPDRQVLLRDELEQPVHFVTRIDDDPLSRARARDNEAVLVERPHGLRLDYDHAVILAILDDLLFTSKIRSAAAQAGAAVTFARSSAAALEQMRAGAPSLVILDLNNPRTDPLGIVATMRGDTALASVPTVGYVSHVDTTTIDAARAAGVGEVLPRSAFTTRLPDILSKARS